MMSSNETLLLSPDNEFQFHQDAILNEKLSFMKKHPIQPDGTQLETKMNIQKCYSRSLTGRNIKRNWVSVHVLDKKAIYCSTCIAFSANRDSTFIKGCTNFKHIYDSLSKHENSSAHNQAVEDYIRSLKNSTIEDNINRELLREKRTMIENNVHVVRVLVDIIKLIGRQNLPYRG